MNGQVEVTWRTLRTVAHALMVHARVPEVYVHFALMYTTDHIFPVLPIKDIINKDGDPTRVNETLKVLYLLPVCVALLDRHPRL